MNKSFLTNLIAFIMTVVGFAFDIHYLFMVGLFAFSGAVTNWLAVYMLFEKIPLLYGSGVVVNKFEEFKSAISNLIMSEFFSRENIKRFFEDELKEGESRIDFHKILDNTDFSLAFDSLKNAVMESSFGGMLGMFGGEKALEPLKEPFTNKLKNSIVTIAKTDEFQNALNEGIKNTNISEDIYEKIEIIVQKRLDELTPLMVKEMVQRVIKEHLGWLVIWGGVFGGLIGLVSSMIL